MAGNLFVGSSSESRATAELVAQRADARGLNPLRWWNIFANGTVPLDVLIQIADDAEAAILIWSSDDRVWYRGKPEDSPRDNCLLEYGLFASRLGRRRTGVLARRGVRLPSDVAAVTVQYFDDEDVEASIDRLITDLLSAIEPSSPSIVPIHTDDEVWRKAVGSETVPIDWVSRALYVRDEGANMWRRIAANPTYTLYSVNDSFGLNRLLKAAIAAIEPSELGELHRMMSLGTGDGSREREVHQYFRERQVVLEWVPVDISPGLLSYTVYRLQRQLPIDRAIVADFEQGLNFCFNAVHSRDNPVPRLPLFITLLGGTFGNLDVAEDSFIAGLKGHMNDGDYLFFDLPVKGLEWSFAADPRTDVTLLDDDSVRFVFQGLAARLQKTTHELANKDRLEILSTSESSIPNTDVIVVRDRETRYPLSRFRRYDWPSVRQWFRDQSGFQIIFDGITERQAAGSPDVRRMGVFLLKRI